MEEVPGLPNGALVDAGSLPSIRSGSGLRTRPTDARALPSLVAAPIAPSFSRWLERGPGIPNTSPRLSDGRLPTRIGQRPNDRRTGCGSVAGSGVAHAVGRGRSL